MWLGSTLIVLLLASAEDNQILLGEAAQAFRRAGSPGTQPEQALTLYRQAAAFCDELRRRGIQNPALFRNQGNAHLLSGELPRAILAYRRGLELAPHDNMLRANLEYARQQVRYAEGNALGRQPMQHWPPWLPRPTPRAGFWLAALGYAAGWIAATRYRMQRDRRLLATAASGFFLAGLLGVYVFWHEHDRVNAAKRPLVVVAAEGVLLHNGNGFGYPPRYDTPLPQGVEARLLYARGDWLQVELPGGEVGWLPREHVLVDEP